MEPYKAASSARPCSPIRLLLARNNPAQVSATASDLTLFSGLMSYPELLAKILGSMSIVAVLRLRCLSHESRESVGACHEGVGQPLAA
jgi:hypothetical protein